MKILEKLATFHFKMSRSRLIQSQHNEKESYVVYSFIISRFQVTKYIIQYCGSLENFFAHMSINDELFWNLFR